MPSGGSRRCAWAAETRWRSPSNAIDPVSKSVETDNEFSKRAAILRCVLDFINKASTRTEKTSSYLEEELRKVLSQKSPYSEKQKAKFRSLPRKVDPTGVIEAKCARSKDSYFRTLINEATKRKILKEDPARLGREGQKSWRLGNPRP